MKEFIQRRKSFVLILAILAMSCVFVWSGIWFEYREEHLIVKVISLTIITLSFCFIWPKNILFKLKALLDKQALLVGILLFATSIVMLLLTANSYDKNFCPSFINLFFTYQTSNNFFSIIFEYAGALVTAFLSSVFFAYDKKAAIISILFISVITIVAVILGIDVTQCVSKYGIS